MKQFVNKTQTVGLYETRDGYSVYVKGECISSGISKWKIETLDKNKVITEDFFSKIEKNKKDVVKFIENEFLKFESEDIGLEELFETDGNSLCSIGGVDFFMSTRIPDIMNTETNERFKNYGWGAYRNQFLGPTFSGCFYKGGKIIGKRKKLESLIKKFSKRNFEELNNSITLYDGVVGKNEEMWFGSSTQIEKFIIKILNKKLKMFDSWKSEFGDIEFRRYEGEDGDFRGVIELYFQGKKIVGKEQGVIHSNQPDKLIGTPFVEVYKTVQFGGRGTGKPSLLSNYFKVNSETGEIIRQNEGKIFEDEIENFGGYEFTKAQKEELIRKKKENAKDLGEDFIFIDCGFEQVKQTAEKKSRKNLLEEYGSYEEVRKEFKNAGKKGIVVEFEGYASDGDYTYFFCVNGKFIVIENITYDYDNEEDIEYIEGCSSNFEVKTTIGNIKFKYNYKKNDLQIV